MSRALAIGLAALALAACGKDDEPAPAGGGAPGGAIKVAGAADLVYAMEELAPAFEEQTGTKVTFIPGSSGKLAAQIKQGAPFDVFLSANVAFVDDAIAANACLADTRALYAYGRLVMWTRAGGAEPPATLAGLAAPSWKTIAIAQPDHAPYGAAAKAALERVGAWSALEPRMVYGSNIKDTMQMAETGNADLAIIALALAIKSKGRHHEIAADQHPAIEQGLAVCRAGNEAGGRAFAAFMRSPAARAILEAYGFGLPE